MKLLLTLLTLSLVGLAAESGASLSGSVKDPQSRPISGAAVTLVSRTGMAGSATTTRSTGAYRFEALPEGDYLLRAEFPGFAVFLSENIHLQAGAAETQEIGLTVAGVHQQVVVTASSTPQIEAHVSKSTTVIEQSDADSRGATTLSDVVADAPGVRVQQLGGPGSLTSIQIRGLRAEDTAVLIDGLRLRDASATQADATGLIEDMLFTDTSQVEILRGSGSSLYGTNAVGGVVNVITDEGGGRTRGSVLMEGGSLGTWRGRAQVAGGFRGDRIQYSLGLSQVDVTGGVGGDAPFRDTSMQGRATFHISPNVRLIARIFAGDSFAKVQGDPVALGSPSGLGILDAVPLTTGNAAIATFMPAPDDPDSTRAARYLTGALILNGEVTPALDYSVSYQLLANGRRYGNGPAGTGYYQPEGSTRSLYDGRIQTVNAQVHYRLGRYNLLSGGYEFESEHYANDNSDRSDPAAASAVNVIQDSNTVLAQDQMRFFGDRLQVSIAGRAQFFTLNNPKLQPLTSAPYQAMTFASPTAAYTGDTSVAYLFHGTGTKLRAHVGRGYRAPSLFERFGVGFDPVQGYSVYGDPRLKPEHSTSFDAGLDQTFFGGRLKTSAGYFYTWLQDVINFDISGLIDPATDPYGRYSGYLNTRGGISRGVELSASVAATHSLNVTTAYTYANAAERAPVVGDVIQSFVIPRNQFSISATERATSRLSLTFDTRASSSYLAPVYGEVVPQTFRFDGIHKVNAGASYRLPTKENQALRFFVRADNMFNQTYFESGFLTPGRTAMGGLQFEF
jgi:iron complex outermembrane receptor protein